MQRLTAVALVSLVILAGCSGSPGGETPTITDPTTQRQDTSRITQAVSPDPTTSSPRTTSENPCLSESDLDLKEFPRKPDPLTIESAVMYAEEFEKVSIWNELATRNARQITVGNALPPVVNRTHDGFIVSLVTGSSANVCSGGDFYHTDFEDTRVNYFVNDSTTIRLESPGHRWTDPRGNGTVVTPDGILRALPTPPDPGPNNTIAFANLSEEQQTTFLDARDGIVRFVPNETHINQTGGYDFDLAQPFRDSDYVRYDGEHYRISFAMGELYRSFVIETAAEKPRDNATVAEFQDLPSIIRSELRTALEEGLYTSPFGKWETIPDQLAQLDYVRYEGTTYVIHHRQHGMHGEYVMTVEKTN